MRESFRSDAMSQPSSISYMRRADHAGLLASALCAVHCALMPALLAALPALGLGVQGLVDFDQAFALFAVALGITTLSLGFRRHRSLLAWAVMIPGLSLLCFGAFVGAHTHSLGHSTMMVLGGLMVAAAHLLNAQLVLETGTNSLGALSTEQ